MVNQALTKSQFRVLDYIAECNRAPPKVHRKTLLALKDAGFIYGIMPWDQRATTEGRQALGRN